MRICLSEEMPDVIAEEALALGALSWKPKQSASPKTILKNRSGSKKLLHLRVQRA